MPEETLFAIWIVGSRIAFAIGIAAILRRWIRQDPALAGRFVVSTIFVVVLGVACVIVLVVDGDAWLTVFLGLPAVAGALAVLLSPGRTRASARIGIGVTAVVLASALLIVLGIEGMVCCLMASPLLALAYGFGTLLGFAIRAVILSATKDDTALRSTAAGLLLLTLPGAKAVEFRRGDAVRIEAVESRVRIAAPPDAVWNALEEIDAVHGPKPLLLRIGLPVPTMCEMEGTGVGARRTCHFDRGRIDEVVSAWDPPHRMELEIVHWTLPGRHWLGYLSASYELRPADNGETEVARITTISSNLRPSWYWRPLEHLGVRAEHDYLLQDVKRRLEVE